MSDWNLVPFNTVFAEKSSPSRKIQRSAYLSAGKFPVIDQGQDLIGGYTNRADAIYEGSLPVIIFGDHTRTFKYVDFLFAAGADGTKILSPQSELGFDCKFLYYYLSSLQIPSAGYSRHFKFLKGLSIPRPPLPEQRRIVELLDKASALQVKRRQALQSLSELAQSIFLDLFGDTDSDDMVALGDFLTFVTSGGRGWAKYYSDPGSRFIRSLDVRMNEIEDRSAVYVTPPNNAEARRTRVHAGDVLLTITGSLIGRVAPAPRHLEGSYVSQHVAILRPETSRIDPGFLAFFLSIPSKGQRQIARLQYGQTKPGLNFDQIRKMRIPLPDISQQRLFMERLIAVRRIAESNRAHLERLEQLADSIQHRAFRGEL